MKYRSSYSLNANNVAVQLDAPQSLLLTLQSGRNQIITGAIRLPTVAGIKFQTQDAEVILSGAKCFICNFQR